MRPSPVLKALSLFLMIFLFVLVPLWSDRAEPAAAQTRRGPRVGRSRKNDTSPPLRDLKPIPAQPAAALREMREPGESNHLPRRPRVQDPVRQASSGLNIPSLMPAPIQNFDGVGNIDGVYPPDTNGDVGPNHYVQWVNLHFQIFNKSGVSLYGPAAGNTLWQGFGGSCETRNDGDPIVLYDSIANRWIMAQFTATNPYGECVAISTTGDPTGSYYRYFFQFSTSVFYDYPHLGVWPDGYYMSANRFGGLFQSYQGASTIVFDRAKMLSGQPATFQRFNLGTSYGTLMPADLDGATLPPGGSPNFFAELGSTVLHFWKFHVDWATPANSTLTGPSNLSIAAYNQLCPSTQNCIPQPNTTVKLDGLGDRLMHRLAYRNLGTHQALVVSHSVNAASSGLNAGVRWYEIRNPNGSPTIHQQGTFAPDASNRWLPSVAMDRSGNIAIGYSISSSSIFPSIRYTGRLAGDPLGQMTQGETTLIAGSGSQTGSGHRWGDYAMMAVDPTDDCTFWFTTEYMPTTGGAPWKTRIGSFKFPSCGSTAPPTATSVPPTTTSIPPTATSAPPTGTSVPPTATSVPPTATRTSVPSQELVSNGGFEGSTTPWTLAGDAYYSTGAYPHSGTGYMVMGYYDSANGSLYQQFSIPSAAASANLTFWLNVTSDETTTATRYDFLYVEVRNTSGTLLQTLASYSNLDKGSVGIYSQKSGFDLSAYKGQTIRLQFRATTDSLYATAFRVDDVSVR